MSRLLSVSTHIVLAIARLFLVDSMLTSNLPDGVCPGQELIYTCVSAGNSHRWTINIVADSDPLELTIRSSTSSTITQMVNSHPFSVTLVSANYFDFTSTLTTIAV